MKTVVFQITAVCNSFAILMAGDCKSPEHKEVRTFFDDGLQIRRNAQRGILI